ncbi:MAG TPA: hypothetical protein VF618_24480 [Thermoanaerobaculia bacterium]
MQTPKHERFAEFLRRLAVEPEATSEQTALDLIGTVLTAVEDELTDVPANPERWMTDGRMYPPQPDSRRSA